MATRASFSSFILPFPIFYVLLAISCLSRFGESAEIVDNDIDYFELNETDLHKLEKLGNPDSAKVLRPKSLAVRDDGDENAGNGINYEVFVRSYSFGCYVCNSRYDSDCESGDLDILAKYRTNCTHERAKPPPNTFFEKLPAVGCRKVSQAVKKDFRILRQCAFSGKNMHGKKRIGTIDITRYFYQCDSESYCNKATMNKGRSQKLLMYVAVAVSFAYVSATSF